jgi:hypothetical protein
MSITVMKLALEALEKSKAALAEELSAWDIDPPLRHVLEAHDLCEPAITALRAAIEQAEKQEPRHIVQSNGRHSPLLTHMMNSRNTPPAAQRPWVGLTDEEISELWAVSRAAVPRYATYASLVEAKLRSKNI